MVCFPLSIFAWVCKLYVTNGVSEGWKSNLSPLNKAITNIGMPVLDPIPLADEVGS